MWQEPNFKTLLHLFTFLPESQIFISNVSRLAVKTMTPLVPCYLHTSFCFDEDVTQGNFGKVLKSVTLLEIRSLSLLRSAVSSLSQCGLTKRTKINLECLIFTTTPHFSLFFPVWGFKDQTHSMWCFVYTVWCHHTNLARQFCPTASPFMEWRASSARFLSVSMSNWNPDDKACHTSTST